MIGFSGNFRAEGSENVAIPNKTLERLMNSIKLILLSYMVIWREIPTECKALGKGRNCCYRVDEGEDKFQ